MKYWFAIILEFSLLLSSCSIKTGDEKNVPVIISPKIELNEKLGWEELESFITHFKDEPTDLATGKIEIIEFLNTHYPEFDTRFLADFDFDEIKKELIEWAKVPLTQDPPAADIKSLYFGLFTSSDKQLADELEEIKVLYIAGSTVNPTDTDWAVDPAYLPEARYYYIPEEFKIIEIELRKYENVTDVEQIVYNGLINLILTNCKIELSQIMKRPGAFGSGFDEGDAFDLGEF